MINYAVFLEGNNFELTHAGKKDLFGFFITVRIEADSESEAKSEAIQLVKSDPELSEAYRADAKEAPVIKVKVVHELLSENKMNKTKYTFFSM